MLLKARVRVSHGQRLLSKNLTNFAKINAQKRKFDKMQILKFFKAR